MLREVFICDLEIYALRYKLHNWLCLTGDMDCLNQPVEGVIVQSQDQKYTGTTDSNGNYRIGRIAAGTYTFLIAGTGYHSVLQTITIATGTGSKADFTIEKQMQRVA